MIEKIIPPIAPILVESTRSVGYSFEAAVADIIDNSISKQAKNIYIYCGSNAPQYLAVIDDGMGMSKDGLINAMKYGSRSSMEERDSDDLGRFGLGLKMASLSQCRKLTVISSQNGRISGACWDLDHIIKTENWSLLILDDGEINKTIYIDKLKHLNSGTIVLWENFDRIAEETINSNKVFNNNMLRTRGHIALVFHRYLSDKDAISIYLNNDKIEPMDPFFTNYPATQQLEEEIRTIAGNIIKIRPYILPYISKLSKKDRELVNGYDGVKLNQGFYVYRNRRLIIWGTWFRMTKRHELKQLTRIKVDIPNTMDSLWEIDIKKSTASIPEVIKKELRIILDKAVLKSEKVYTYRGRITGNDDLEHVWNIVAERDNKIGYYINRENILYKKIVQSLEEDTCKIFEIFLKQIEALFPYQDVYTRLLKNYDSVQSPVIDKDELYQTLYSMLYDVADTKRVKIVLKDLEKNEIFTSHQDIIKKLKEDFKYE